MIGIIDYGLGNVKAFYNVYRRLNIDVMFIDHQDNLHRVDKIILPGVGSYDYAINRLNNSGMRDMLDFVVIEKKIPVLGICVGMQMLAKSSEEGKLKGLGWIDSDVRRFESLNTRIPHMGWNDVIPQDSSPLFRNLYDHSIFYFLHSFYVHCNQKDNVIATTEYGFHFASAINFKNIFGVQFHPEKSHNWGIQLLKNFAEIS